MALRRGFKAEANWYARELRGELGLPAASPLCPWKLADHLGFPIQTLSEYAHLEPHAVAYFQSEAGRGEFSAMALDVGGKRWIIHNDSHDPKRQAANIAHELAHGLLLHPSNPLLNAAGTRHYDPVQEEEANWLGPALLVSEEAALLIARHGMVISDASSHYGVSEDVIRMRMNVCGAKLRVIRRGAA